MFSKQFWKGAVERAVKSAAQGVIVFWGVGDGVLNLWSVDPTATAGVAAGMAALSLVTSLASMASGPAGSPSLVDEQARSL